MPAKDKTNKNLKPCKSCSRVVAKSVNKCPHCGATLKTGLFTKIVATSFALIALALIFGPSNEEIQAKQNASLDQLSSTPASSLSPGGDLAKTFELGSAHTDIQRDNLEQEITGLVVEWTLPVYEVKKSQENTYRIQTASTVNTVGVFATITTRSTEEITYIESLKTGDRIKIKGTITGVSLRHVRISPSVLLN